MLSALIGSGLSLFERTKWFREIGLDTNTVKRLLLTECRKNLALLEPLKLSGSEFAQNASAFVAVASCLQFDAIEALASADDKAAKAYDELAKIPYETGGELGADAPYSLDESAGSKVVLSERIMRLYVRMSSVRTYAELTLRSSGVDLEGVAQIQFKRRLGNIQKVLLALERILSGEAAV